MTARALGYVPLAPFAAAGTAAILVDRFLSVPARAWFAVAAVGLVVWLAAARRKDAAPLVGLWLCAGGLAGAYHHGWRDEFPANDVGHWATPEPRLLRVRGSLAEEPSVRRRPANDPLVSRPRVDSTVTTLRVTDVDTGDSWQPASGNVRVTVEGVLTGIHIGDTVEATGWLSRPSGPMNPGEWDFADRLRDERIRSELRIPHATAGLVRLESGGWGLGRALAFLRGLGQQAIRDTLPPSEQSIAAALLLGDGAAMTGEEWERYVRTGVIHVLAISGQHLVILGGFFWLVLRLVGVPRKTAAVTVALLLLTYALVTGGRPSAMRAAVIAGAYSGAILLRTRALPANSFALAWIVVLVLNPTDLFTAGFQLSFLCVAVLVWGIPRWFPKRPLTPLEELVEESRSIPERLARGAVRGVGRAYRIALVLGLATAPLIAYWQHLVAPVGVLIGPPAILLTTVALIAGFLLIFLAPLGPLAAPVAWVASQALALSEVLVAAAGRLPAGCWYVGSVPTWWVVGFYLIGGIWMLMAAPDRARLVPDLRRPGLFPGLLAGWLALGLAAGMVRSDPDELRVTVLAVDHGACVVIEAPDGRVLLYDAGATSGPDVARRRIAPFLWSRGIRRIDELFLSHADLDHFNGVPALLDRFAVGQVTVTPTFQDRPTGGVRRAVEAIERRGTPVRIARSGDRFAAGDVLLEVLHPPPDGPAGVENVRSLVLLVRHRGHRILLTGDLEGPGLDALTGQPAPPIDVLLAPHHGSGTRAGLLADWARPRFVVSSQGRSDVGKAEDVYQARGIPYWKTWPDGAVTLRSHASGLTAESFATGQRQVVRAGSGE